MDEYLASNQPTDKYEPAAYTIYANLEQVPLFLWLNKSSHCQPYQGPVASAWSVPQVKYLGKLEAAGLACKQRCSARFFDVNSQKTGNGRNMVSMSAVGEGIRSCGSLVPQVLART